MTNTRRSDFDVTNSVQVSSPRAVLAAVEALFRPTWPGMSIDPLRRAFAHFERLFAGEVPGYHGVDTVYHDRQHTLDITLALARLLVGYERQQDTEETRMGGARAAVALITGLFHDVGYLRRSDDREFATQERIQLLRLSFQLARGRRCRIQESARSALSAG